jgi:hypothetical protein
MGPHELNFLEELAKKILALPPQGLDDPPLPPFLSRERTSFPQELSTEELRGETGEAIKIEYGPDPREAPTPCRTTSSTFVPSMARPSCGDDYLGTSTA